MQHTPFQLHHLEVDLVIETTHLAVLSLSPERNPILPSAYNAIGNRAGVKQKIRTVQLKFAPRCLIESADSSSGLPSQGVITIPVSVDLETTLR